MRRTERYTTASEAIKAPGLDVYRQSYSELSLIAKFLVLVHTWFGGESVGESVRHWELRSIFRRLEREHHDIVDPAVPVLLDGFVRRVRELNKRVPSIATVVQETTGERAGRFLHSALKTINPETAEQLEAATRVPEEVLDNPSVTLEEASAALKEQMEEALELHQAIVLRDLGTVWACLNSLKHLTSVSLKNVLPAGNSREARIPLRIVQEDLIALYRELEHCRKNKDARGLDIAVEFATQRLGRSFAVYREIWNVIDELLDEVPFLDILRLGLEEPRATIKPVAHSHEWWELFATSWIESLEAGPSILRHRSFRIESILHDDFAVVAPAITWIPSSLYQRTVGALRRLASGTEFRQTRVFVGTLSREEGLLRPASRKDLLNAHVQLDQQLDQLEDLIGSGDKRGKIGEEVKRLNATTTDASLVRIQMSGMLSRYRQPVRIMIENAIEALATIHRVCSTEEQTIARGSSRLNTTLADSLGEVTPRYILDLIVHRYAPLVDTLQGLSAIERELTVGAEPDTEELIEAVE